MTKKNKKHKMENCPIDVYEPSTTLQVSKEMAGDVSVGETITVKVSGKVVSVRSMEHMEGDENYQIEIKKSKVFEIEGNKADKAMKEMKGK